MEGSIRPTFHQPSQHELVVLVDGEGEMEITSIGELGLDGIEVGDEIHRLDARQGDGLWEPVHSVGRTSREGIDRDHEVPVVGPLPAELALIDEIEKLTHGDVHPLGCGSH